jgi:hypothetical protein
MIKMVAISSNVSWDQWPSISTLLTVCMFIIIIFFTYIFFPILTRQPFSMSSQ